MKPNSNLIPQEPRREKVFFKTFGCRTNIYDTELMKSYVKDYDIVSDENEADIVVVNSCTVTNSADSGARSYINGIKKRGARVILTGCGAVSKGKELFNKNSVFGVIGASKKEDINALLKSQDPFFELGNLKSIDKTTKITPKPVSRSKRAATLRAATASSPPFAARRAVWMRKRSCARLKF